jgi:hypothetical protein
MLNSNQIFPPTDKPGEDFEIKLGFIVIRIKRITVKAIIALVIVLTFLIVLIKL